MSDTRARRRGLQAGIGIVLVIAAVFLYRTIFVAPPEEPGEEAIPVIVRHPASLERSAYISVSGEVEARSSVNVAFKVPGTVAQVMVEEGDPVQAGQTLASVDDSDYSLQVDLAMATKDEAEDAFQRASQMHDKQGIPPADYVKAEAAVRKARAQAELAQNRLDDATLESPLSGVVAMRGVDPGEPVAPGHPVFTIMAMDPVQVRVGVPEAEIGRVHVGVPVTVTLPSMSGRSFQGRVRLVGVSADPVSRTYTVKIDTPNPDRVLRPGMVAEARIEGESTVQALTLPGEAVVRDLQGATVVFIYRPGEDRAYSRRVEVGSIYGDEVEITSGVDSSDLVVIGGQHRIRDGALVAAEMAQSPAAATSTSSGTGGS